MPVAWQVLAEASSERGSCPIDAGIVAVIVPASPWGFIEGVTPPSPSLPLLQGCIMVPWNLY